MLLLAGRPHAGPRQRNDSAIAVDVAALEVSHQTATAREAHLLTRTVEILGVEEIGGAAPDQLLGAIAEYRQRARADAQEIALAIDHQDEIKRSLKDALVDGACNIERV